MELSKSKIGRSGVFAVATVGLSLAAVLVTHRDANAAPAWCGYSGQSTECSYDSEAECKKSHRACFPKPNE